MSKFRQPTSVNPFKRSIPLLLVDYWAALLASTESAFFVDFGTFNSSLAQYDVLFYQAELQS